MHEHLGGAGHCNRLPLHFQYPLRSDWSRSRAAALLTLTGTKQSLGRWRGAGSTVSFDKVLADIRARDQRDSSRSVAPLVAAEDAATLDTSFLSIEAAVQRAVEIVEKRLAESK